MNEKIMTINLAKGHFNSINGHRVLRVKFNDMIYPCQRYRWSAIKYEEGLPAISEAYETGIRAGMDEEDLIDNLLKLYFPLKFFKIGDYEKMPLVLGFIGMRGSGKTCSGVMVAACDFLLRGLPVWSNVPINIRVVYKDAEKNFSSYDIDDLDMLDLSQDYGGGCVLYDEVNMEAAESTRFSSAANLQFSYAMQQIRKRQLSVIWTCQGWSWIDNRLRWQSDYVMACRDISFDSRKREYSGIGDTSIWRIHDISGTSGKFDYDYELKHHYLSQYIIGTMKAWLRPWWNSYNTELLQGQTNYITDYRQKIAEKRRIEAHKLPGQVGDLPEASDSLESAVSDLINNAGDRDIRCDDVWKYLRTDDKAIQTIVGRLFTGKGYERRGDSKSGRYWRKIGGKTNGI